MTKVAYSVREMSELGLGSQSHIRRMIKVGEIPVVKLGQRELIPSYWIEDNFVKQAEAD
jgi:excisionase family DNA binding protein|tara:strand:- start:83 stop:259 length:177 start_codon:yes stop_codon:yes gene_type:complete